MWRFLTNLLLFLVLTMQGVGFWYTLRAQRSVDGVNERFSKFLTGIQDHTNTARENRLYTEYKFGRLMETLNTHTERFMTEGSPGQAKREVELVGMEEIAKRYNQKMRGKGK